MDSAVRQKIILIYGVIIAFLLSILGGLIANFVYSYFFENSKMRFVIIIIFFLLIHLTIYLIRDFTQIFNVLKPEEHSETPIEYPYELGRNYYEKHRTCNFSLRNISTLYKFLGYLFRYSPAIILSVLMIITYIGSWYFKPWKVLLLFLLYAFFAIKARKLQHWGDLRVLWLARKTKSCVSFLVEGRGFLHPEEFRFEIDFNENKYYFTYYEPNEKIENETKKEIAKILDKIRHRKKEED